MTDYLHTTESKVVLDLCKDHFIRKNGGLRNFFEALKRISWCPPGQERMAVSEACLKLLKEIEEGKHG